MESYNKFAEIYDELINQDIDYNYFASSIISIIDELKIEKDDYLDIACGTGNLSMILGKHFKHTWLVDASEEMLTEAYNKFLLTSIKPKIVCQNMCSLTLNHKFNLITSCLDATNYILEDKDLNSYFISVKEHLKDDGIFIFDINSYYKLSSILGNNIFNYDSEDVFYSWENIFEQDILEMYLTFFVKKEELYERFDEEHIERAYTLDKIKNSLHSADFEILKIMDNYDRAKEVNDKTERITFVVK